jgi:pimeloyl-ACP methyl ester carboxylesterase
MQAAIRLRDGRALGVVEWGATHGFPVLYFHGAMGTRVRPSKETAALLADLDVRWITLERPGFGASTSQPGRRLLDWASDVAEAADALGLERFAVLGVSAGAPYAAACAHALGARVTAAAVISGLGPPPVKAGRRARFVRRRSSEATGARRSSRAGAGSLGLAILRAHPRGCTRVLGAIARVLRRHPRLLLAVTGARTGRRDRAELARPDAGASFVAAFAAATARGVEPMVHDVLLAEGPWGFPLADVHAEVHVWHGALDPFVPLAGARALADALPRGRLVVVPNRGHFLLRENLGAVLRALLGIAPEQPEGRRAAGQVEAPTLDEAVRGVERDVALGGGLEVGGHALGVAALEDRAQERGGDALTLPGRVGPEDREVVVELERMRGLDAGHRPHGAPEPRQQGREQRDHPDGLPEVLSPLPR